jgi:NTP pyrophosphatase (non-canonical NTP hydrolase)|tara:strand:+ start:281 stop:532 length:252 start_codon:yes stop_codon:yes gene_type:complete
MNQEIIDILVITMEECGEMIQELSKCYRTELREDKLIKLSEEVADVEVMISLLRSRNLLNEDTMEEQKRKRLLKLKKYSSIKL